MIRYGAYWTDGQGTMSGRWATEHEREDWLAVLPKDTYIMRFIDEAASLTSEQFKMFWDSRSVSQPAPEKEG